MERYLLPGIIARKRTDRTYSNQTKRSKDGGKTWSDIETIAEDQTGKICSAHRCMVFAKINYICLLMKWYQQIIFMLLIFMYFKRKRTVLNFMVQTDSF